MKNRYSSIPFSAKQHVFKSWVKEAAHNGVGSEFFDNLLIGKAARVILSVRDNFSAQDVTEETQSDMVTTDILSQ